MTTPTFTSCPHRYLTANGHSIYCLDCLEVMMEWGFKPINGPVRRFHLRWETLETSAER
jgi:hypothetical protein